LMSRLMALGMQALVLSEFILSVVGYPN
jgi:hypothetical protein